MELTDGLTTPLNSSATFPARLHGVIAAKVGVPDDRLMDQKLPTAGEWYRYIVDHPYHRDYFLSHGSK